MRDQLDEKAEALREAVFEGIKILQKASKRIPHHQKPMHELYPRLYSSHTIIRKECGSDSETSNI